MTEETFVAVLRAVFMSLGQALGPRVLVNASVLLAGLARDQKLDPKARELIGKILTAVDGD
jgi:hypothetical protein